MADIDLTGLAFLEFTATGDLEVRNASLQGNAAMGMSANGNLTIRNTSLQGNATARMSAAGVLTVKNSTFQGNATMRMSAAGTLNSGQNLAGAVVMEMSATARLGIAIHLAGHADLVLSATGNLLRNRDALGVCDIVREIYLLWGFEYPCAAPDWAREAALTDLNHALQILWNRARDRSYWTQTEITITLISGVSSQVLDDDIQNVIGPARYVDTGEPLIPIGTRQEVDQFPALFLDGEDDGVPAGYYIERQRQAANDPVKCTLHVSPAPAADVDFLLEVVREAPRYSWDDVDRCPRVPVPHRYVESLLIPIARHLAMQRHMAITKPEAREAIERAYAEASMLLDEADPLPAKAGDNLNRRKEERA